MSKSRRSRYSSSPSPSPYRRYGRSVSRSVSRSRSRSCDSSDAENPGNNLYVTGLSARVTRRDVEKHFSTEGKVEDVHLVIDPWTRESRGFGFVTMSSLDEAERCIKYLDRSVLEGRVITVEKARRRRGRTPTPGRYLGLRTVHVRRRSPSYSPYSRNRSPRYSSERDRSRSRSYSPYYRRCSRSYSHYLRRRSYSPYDSRGRSYSRSVSPYERSPVSRRDRSYSPYYRDFSPNNSRYRSRHYRSSQDHCPWGHYRLSSRSISPRQRGRSRRSCLPSVSPRRSWSYSRSRSPSYPRRSVSRSASPYPRRRYKSPSASPRPSSKRSASRGSEGSHKHAPSPYPRRRYKSPSASPRPSSKRSASRGFEGSHKHAPCYDSRSSRSHSRSPSASPSSRSDQSP